MEVLNDIDLLRKYISDPKAKKLLSKIRKQVKQDKSFLNKLYSFFANSLDGGGEPEEIAKDCGLM